MKTIWDLRDRIESEYSVSGMRAIYCKILDGLEIEYKETETIRTLANRIEDETGCEVMSQKWDNMNKIHYENVIYLLEGLDS